VSLSRLLDVVASAGGLVVLSPILLFAAVLVKLTSAGPVFYRSRRVGLHGKEFFLYKFRTMVANSDKVGPAITAAGDPRITKVGAWLRRTKIDELPQLINVFKGEMSLVGPRPEDPQYVALYSAEQRKVLESKPGITSPASFEFRDESSLLQGVDWERKYREEILPRKLRMELEYQQRRSLFSDLLIILQTVASVVGITLRGSRTIDGSRTQE